MLNKFGGLKMNVKLTFFFVMSFLNGGTWINGTWPQPKKTTTAEDDVATGEFTTIAQRHV